MMQAWALILAAGQGRRMGQPKALVAYHGQSLLARTAGSLRQAGWTRILVVRGAEEAAVEALCRSLGLPSVLNAGWAEGMGSSIRAGIAALAAQEEQPTHVLITTVDQAHILPTDYRALLDEAAQFPGIPVAACYGGLPGVPAVFPAAMFPALRALVGDAGARLLLRDGRPLRLLDMAAAALDLDTPDALAH